MMRKLKMMLGSILAITLLLLQTIPAMAAADEYTYTVRLFSGAQGLVNGEEVIVKSGLHYGDRVSFSQRAVTLKNDSKYYVKGIRESGKDNNTVGSTSSFPVTGDMDYVVVYGILGDSVAYTVNYVDRDGNTLAPSETFYGNVGDAPVIAYINIDGYQPQAYNLTGRLKANASDNVFDFIYTPVTSTAATPAATATPAPAAPVSTISPAVQAAPGLTVTRTVTATPAPAAEDGEETDAEDGDEGGGDEAAPAENGAGEDVNGPEELQQIGDEEVPLADMGTDSADVTKGGKDVAKLIGDLPLAAKAGICSAILLGLGAAAWFLLIRKKKQIEIE